VEAVKVAAMVARAEAAGRAEAVGDVAGNWKAAAATSGTGGVDAGMLMHA